MPSQIHVEKRGERSFAAACPTCKYEFIAPTADEVRGAVESHVEECSDSNGEWVRYDIDSGRHDGGGGGSGHQ
jgi:flagella basal body P-ring formation protein FlgA